MSDGENRTAPGTPERAAPQSIPGGPWTAPDAAPPRPVPPNSPQQPGAQPRYAPPAGYSPPAQPAAPAAGAPPVYAAPVGHHAPTAPSHPIEAPEEPASRRRTGAIALVLALVAAVLTPLLVSIAAFEIGRGTMTYDLLASSTFDWSILTPVRDWVLVAEVSFWIGTACGIWAIVQGIVAVVRRSGRGLAIAAIIVAAVGPLLFFVALQVGIVAGAASGIAAL